MTWSIGNLILNSRAIQSPMVGCTDWAYRKLIREQGAELAFCEMLSSEAFIRNSQKSDAIVRRTPEDDPTGAQIMGADPTSMAKAAKKLEAMNFKLIDINVGCPAKKIVRQGAGSALLKDESLFGRIINSVVSAVSIPVTAKLRIGYEKNDEAQFIRLLKIAEQEGVAALAIHGRTQEQKFSGEMDPEPIRIAKQTVSCPIIGNGDVTNGEKAKSLIEKTGCDAVMIGRGSLGNPWIFREVQAVLNNEPPPPRPTLEEQIETLITHMKLMVEWHGEKLGMIRLRKLVSYYFDGHPRIREFHKAGVRVSKPQDLLDALEKIPQRALSSSDTTPAAYDLQLMV